MWPLAGDALSRTLECEAALADVYAEALNKWVIDAAPLVVPTLDGKVVNGDPALVAASLPVNPDATEQTSDNWNHLSTETVLTCLSVLWCLALIESMDGLGIDPPEIVADAAKIVIAAAVIRAITSTSSVKRAEIIDAVTRVESDAHLRSARDDFLASQRSAVAAAPTLIRDKVASAIREAEALAIREPGGATTTVVIQRQREAATAIMAPGSQEIRDVARYQGYQAAGVQNAAVIEAGGRSPDTDLDKTWIATLDGKTRPTHFAADGQRAPLDGSFTVGGEQLPYPGFPGGSPAEVKNCRCRVGVLAKDEEIPDEVDRHTERLNGRDSVQINRKGSQQDEINRRAEDGTIRARDDEDGIGRTAGGPPDMTTTADVDLASEDDADTDNTYRTFTDQPIAFIGIETSDGRMLSKDIDLSFRSFPQPVMWTKQTGYGHEDAFTVGVIEAAKIDGDQVLGSGYLLNSAESDEAAAQLEHTATRPSVDLAQTEWILTDEDGNEITEEQWWDMPIDAKVIQTITAAELIGCTLVATPAFGDTMLQLNAERETRESSLVASAAVAFQPKVYAADLFTDPKLTEPTLPSIDEKTGRIFGHLACFGECHRSVQSQCVITPKSSTNYGHFHTSPAVRLDNGERLPVGRLTVGTGHAPDRLGPAPAAAHYDNTGTCFALVRVGEDKHGIWFSGVAAPGATAEQIEVGLSAPLSGDWRDFGRGLELVAALAVNTPGFAVRGRSGSDGRPAALVAALGPDPRGSAGGSTFDAQGIAAIVEAAVQRGLAKRETEVEAASLIAAADSLVGPLPTPNEEIGTILEGIEL